MLSQILAVGSLFTQKAFSGEEAKASNDSDDDELTPEELRKEIFEQILKKRIFYSDRVEKIEKVLLNRNLIPKD